MKPLVIITDATDLDPSPAIAALETAGCAVRVLDLVSHPVVPDDARGAVAAIVGYARIDAEVLAQLPDLRVLATTSTGTDMIDADSAHARGIEVIGLVDVATVEVATHALMLMLAALRGLPASQSAVAAGHWSEAVAFVPPAAEELTLGLLGYGRIARAVAERAQPLFAGIIAHDPYVEVSGLAQAVDLDTLFAASDIVSLHVPLTPDNAGLVSAERIARMRRGAVLVNVSRGELVKEDAIVAALDEGMLSAYAADVLAGEPPQEDNPLRRHPRAIVTPHVAYRSNRSMERYVLDPAASVLDRIGMPSATYPEEITA